MGLAGFLTVTEYNPAYAETADRGSVNRSESITSRSLSILTFNTGYGTLGAETAAPVEEEEEGLLEDESPIEGNLVGIEGIMGIADADFVFLQEVDVDSERSYSTNQWLRYEYGLEKYESRFALNHSCEYVPYPLKTPVGKIQSGLATYSNYDIVSATRFSLPNSYTWPHRVVNQKHCLLVTRIPLEDSEQQLVLINVHLEAYEDGEMRREQIDQLVSFMKEEYAKGNFVVAGGDFNSTFPGVTGYDVQDPEKWAPKKLTTIGNGYRYIYDDSTPTYRMQDNESEDAQMHVIDGFLVSPNVIVDQVETLNYAFIYSDHNPVMMHFTLNVNEE